MNKNKFKLLALMISFFLTLGLVPSFTTHASEINNNEIIQSNNLYDLDESMYNDDTSQDILSREKRGIKSKAVLKIARMLLKNTNKLVGTLKAAGVLDAESALALGANCSKISAYLERVANYGEDAAAFVRNNLPSVMNGWGIDSGISETVAYALSLAIRGADWIFG